MVEGEVKFEGINNMQSKRYLVLEDGSFRRLRLGSDNNCRRNCSNTMTGYQKLFRSIIYRSIITFTYPLIVWYQ